MAVDLDRIGRASLKELGDIRIDDVLAFIDRGIEKMPSYMDLYRRWESQQWSVGDIAFNLDRQDWLESDELDRKATLWSHRLFFNGEERVTSTLAPFVWAAPTPEIEIFLSTQMVDEARHTVFFQRWWHEVVGTGAKSLGELLTEIRPEANEGYNILFYERLPSTAQRLASNPKDFDAFVEGVTLYHIVIAATIALTGQRFELEAMSEQIFTDPEVARWWGDPSKSVADAMEVLEGDSRFVIEHDGNAIGFIQASEETDPMYTHASIDISLRSPWQGKGLGPDAIRTLARFLIHQRGHHRLTIDPAAHNTSAIKAYERVGFK